MPTPTLCSLALHPARKNRQGLCSQLQNMTRRAECSAGQASNGKGLQLHWFWGSWDGGLPAVPLYPPV